MIKTYIIVQVDIEMDIELQEETMFVRRPINCAVDYSVIRLVPGIWVDHI